MTSCCKVASFQMDLRCCWCNAGDVRCLNGKIVIRELPFAVPAQQGGNINLGVSEKRHWQRKLMVCDGNWPVFVAVV